MYRNEFRYIWTSNILLATFLQIIIRWLFLYQALSSCVFLSKISINVSVGMYYYYYKIFKKLVNDFELVLKKYQLPLSMIAAEYNSSILLSLPFMIEYTV